MQGPGGGEAVRAGQGGVQDGDVRLEGQRRGHHLIAALQFGDDVNVAGTGKKGYQSRADQRSLLCNKCPDHPVSPVQSCLHTGRVVVPGHA